MVTTAKKVPTVKRSVAPKRPTVKSAVKAVTKPIARPTAKPSPMPAANAAPPITVKADKPKKVKLVRDSFTIPKPEYVVLDDLKQRAAKQGRTAKKSELLRAGIKALAALSDAALLAALQAVPTIKTGRPKA